MARSIVATDDFNRASMGTDWVQFLGPANEFAIQASTYYANPSSYADCLAKRSIGTYANAQYSKAIVGPGLPSTGVSQLNVTVRNNVSGGNSCYALNISSDGTTPPRLYLQEGGGSYVLLGTFGSAYIASSVNDEWILEVDDTNPPIFKCFHNATQIGSPIQQATGTIVTTGVAGLGSFVDAANPWQVTAWEGGNVTADTGFGGVGVVTRLRLRAQPAAGVFGSVYRITGTLVDPSTGLPRANLTNIDAAFFDQAQPSLLAAPVQTITNLSTNASGVFSWDLPGSALIAGQTGLFVPYHAGLGYLGAYLIQAVA